MLPDQKTPGTSFPIAVLVVVALLACACVSAPAPKTVPPPVTPILQLTGTPGTGNQSTVHPGDASGHYLQLPHGARGPAHGHPGGHSRQRPLPLPVMACQAGTHPDLPGACTWYLTHPPLPVNDAALAKKRLLGRGFCLAFHCHLKCQYDHQDTCNDKTNTRYIDRTETRIPAHYQGKSDENQ